MIFDFNFIYFADNKFENYLLNNSKTTIMAAVGFASLDTPQGATPVKPAPLLFLAKNHLRLNSAVCFANPRPTALNFVSSFTIARVAQNWRSGNITPIKSNFFL